MWRWVRAYGIGGSSLYLAIVGLLLLFLLPEGDANVFWLALILGVPAAGAALFLRGCLIARGGPAHAMRIGGWLLMLLGLYGLVSFSMFVGPLLLFCLPAALMRPRTEPSSSGRADTPAPQQHNART